jgi:hypothetical protein
MKASIVTFSFCCLIVAIAGCSAAPDPEGSTGTDSSAGDEPVSTIESALSNVYLYPGQQGTFPTWTFWGWTNVRITNPTSTWGCVALQVGNAPAEQVCAGPSSRQTVARQWAGLPLNVRNVGAVPLLVDVW